MKQEEIRIHVRDRYAQAAVQGTSCCGPASSCCGNGMENMVISKNIGYTDLELNAVPEGANLGLGCGNPLALASLREGETVLDLGSGAGFDCFLASRQVGEAGKIIGVDMTPEMLDKARKNSETGGFKNVEFRLGEIENLPVADNQADIVISNCVINLSPAKNRVFHEAFRVLKPGGRLMVSDIVLLQELPEEIRASVAAYTACVAGAETRENYLSAIRNAGFQDIRILKESVFPTEFLTHDPTVCEVLKALNLSSKKAGEIAESIVSVSVSAIKPGA
ncbi:MAG: arsenite methyltransferase [Thermodesulfobacteriota bacterium]